MGKIFSPQVCKDATLWNVHGNGDWVIQVSELILPLGQSSVEGNGGCNHFHYLNGYFLFLLFGYQEYRVEFLWLRCIYRDSTIFKCVTKRLPPLFEVISVWISTLNTYSIQHQSSLFFTITSLSNFILTYMQLGTLEKMLFHDKLFAVNIKKKKNSPLDNAWWMIHFNHKKTNLDYLYFDGNCHFQR